MAAPHEFVHRDLEHPALSLRALRPSDAGPISLFAADRRVAEMTTTIPHPYPPGAAEAFIDGATSGRGAEQVWAIDATPGDGPEFIGVISYREKTREIGYWIGPPFWGTGHATTAVRILCQYLLIDLGMSELNAFVLFDNPASQQVLKKAGFRHVGDTRLYSVARGLEIPALSFRLVPTDLVAPAS